MQSQWITLESSDGFLCPAWEAVPEGTPRGAVVVLQEIFGVNSHIRAVAEQYALDGFVVLAPDVFWRQAPKVELGYEGDDRQRAFGLMQGYSGADALADIEAAVKALRARPETAGAKVGTFGYCMGGRLAYLAAATAGVDAAVAFYGGGIQGALDRAAAVSCPIQFHYAEHDDHIPPDAVESVRRAFAGRPAEVHVYPGAMHGFNCWARASYHAPSAALAHGRALAFLAAALN